MTDEEKVFLESEINRQYQWYNRGSKLWSAVHHWSLAMSALLSALATLVLKSEWIKTFVVTYREDVAAGLAAAATLLTTLQPPAGLEGNGKPTDKAEGKWSKLKLIFRVPTPTHRKSAKI